MADDAMDPAAAQRIAAEYVGNRIASTQPQPEPKAVLIAGQPGAGKTQLAAKAMAELRQQGRYIRVDADRLREYLPEHGQRDAEVDPAAVSARTQTAAAQVASIMRTTAIGQRRNVVEEGTFRDPKGAAAYIDALHREDYEVEMRVLAVPFEESRLGARAGRT